MQHLDHKFCPYKVCDICSFEVHFNVELTYSLIEDIYIKTFKDTLSLSWK